MNILYQSKANIVNFKSMILVSKGAIFIGCAVLSKQGDNALGWVHQSIYPYVITSPRCLSVSL